MSDVIQRIKRLRANQRAVLDQVALGNDDCHHPATLEALERAGLLQHDVETLPGRFLVRIKRYYMPLAIHVHWCELTSREVELAGGIEVVERQLKA